MVVLVLMNVLIAIASDSYEKCLIRSDKMFGRARVMMVAESVAFQNLLKRHPSEAVDSSSMVPVVSVNSTWLSGRTWCCGWSRGSLAFLVSSLSVVVVWAFGEVAGFASGDHKGNLYMSVASILVTVVLFFGIVLYLEAGARSESTEKISGPSRFEAFLQNSMLRLLGSTKDTGRAFSKVDDGWQGRLVYLSSEMQRITETSHRMTQNHMQRIEALVQSTESRLTEDIENIKECVRRHQQEAFQSPELKEAVAAMVSLRQKLEDIGNTENDRT